MDDSTRIERGPGRYPGPGDNTWLVHYRECLLKITYDDQPFPSVLIPLGDLNL